MMIVIAILIKLDSKGPVFFVQERIGQNGRPFKMMKFRTMVVDAEQQLEKLVDFKKLDQPMFKIKNDPRITRVGRFLRRSSLDELPQLFNVLTGEMSWWGHAPKRSASWICTTTGIGGGWQPSPVSLARCRLAGAAICRWTSALRLKSTTSKTIQSCSI
ncbi:MAG: hypothetical protein HC893_04215 [Chloroflexaceae bacterium]|nr:hypothetical protein [Chloroflexaceae bacterium]